MDSSPQDLQPVVLHGAANGAPTPENPLLTTYRGHRTRTWGDQEALKCLQLISEGHSAVSALRLAGIPYGAHEHPVLGEAIREVYAHEGAAYFEELARLGAQGEHDPRAAQYVRMMLELHWKLKERAPESVTYNGPVLQVLGLSGPELAQAAQALLARRGAQAQGQDQAQDPRP